MPDETPLPTYLRPWAIVDQEELRLLRKLYEATTAWRYTDHRLDELATARVKWSHDELAKFMKGQ